MSSSFRRKIKSENETSSPSSSANLLVLKGTKPWTGGITLTSTGLRDFDQILGGGQPLGTCIWLEEDRWSGSLALCLIKYWCAEAISQDQHLLIPCDCENDYLDVTSSSWSETDEQSSPPLICAATSRATIRKLLRGLPRNLHKDKQQQAAQIEAQQSEASMLGTLIEEGNDDEADHDPNADDADAGLKIAWQYRTSVQQERQGVVTTTRSSSSDIYCHSYDLHTRLYDQVDVLKEVATTHLPLMTQCCCCTSNQQQACSSPQQCAFAYFCLLVREINRLLSETASRKVIRLMLYHSKPFTLQIALPLLLAHVRYNRLPVVVFVAVQPWVNDGLVQQQQLCLGRRSSDVVLREEGFASRRDYPPPPEFRLFHGILHVDKASTFTAATAQGHFADLTVTKRPSAHLYGLKRDRRKLHIELLHIPPEDFAQGGGSVGGGARTGAGRLNDLSGGGLGCAASGGGSSKLDF